MRHIKPDTQERLRREVGFGCPVCRSPFLTFHHFDPPYHEGKSHNEEGMIAMCEKCHHGDADEKGGRPGNYSIEELRAMKRADYSSSPVSDNFPSLKKKELLIRFGGSYADANSPVLSINGIPQISFARNESGLLLLSFELRDQNDNIVLSMENNCFTAFPQHVPRDRNLIVRPHIRDIKLWLTREDIGLDLSFQRITEAQLDCILAADKERADKAADMHSQERVPRTPPFWVDRLPEHLREIYLSADRVGTGIKQWVRTHCVDSDGLIPFINFEQFVIYFHGLPHAVNHGVDDFFDYNNCIGNRLGAINRPCRCLACMR